MKIVHKLPCYIAELGADSTGLVKLTLEALKLVYHFGLHADEQSARCGDTMELTLGAESSK